MQKLYQKDNVNYPKLATDTFFIDYNNTFAYRGKLDEAVKFIEDFQLLDRTLWKRFVQQFREDADWDAGWRGEYWGKMMCGACLVYQYTKNETLYAVLKETVCDIMTTQDELGRISTYFTDHEFDGWDIWSRKYVLLGMQSFLEICTEEELNQQIIASMCKQADYILSKIGKVQEGKKDINSATRHWRGLNSSSILEPIMRLYNLTKKQEYLDFATYIVERGGTDIVNIFQLAYEDQLYPYQYPVTKAYEMISCFEGLLEYYRIYKNEQHKQAVLRFADKILKSDFTVIGCCGCTHELFDHSTVRQANPININDARMQETCVTISLMRFFSQLNLVTGDSKYIDAFEISLYNAYLGALNTERQIEPNFVKEHPDFIIEPLPFDSYSPLTVGQRGCGIGGWRKMSDNHYYGCCACYGAVGIGLVPKTQLLTTDNGFALNLFIDGMASSTTPKGQKVELYMHTKYPVGDTVAIEIRLPAEEEFELLIRNPEWNKQTNISVNQQEVAVEKGYIPIKRKWKNGDRIEYSLDMRTQAIYPIPYGEQVLMNCVRWGKNYVIPTYDKEDEKAKDHIALRRGPIMLAQDDRLGYAIDKAFPILVNENGYVECTVPRTSQAEYAHWVEMQVPLANGDNLTMIDYGSAGKLWSSKNQIAVWILTK